MQEVDTIIISKYYSENEIFDPLCQSKIKISTFSMKLKVILAEINIYLNDRILKRHEFRKPS